MIDIGSDQVLISEMTEQAYKDASFLDRRIITPNLKWQAVKWDELGRVVIPKNMPPYYIFHIGHVGSTLISRLLGECSEILALREPQILRDFGEVYKVRNTPQSSWSVEMYAKRFDQVIAWHSRTFREDQRAMIKVSSFVSNLADDLIGQNNRSLFLYVSLESYLETILAGDVSRQEADSMDIGGLNSLSHVQKIALGWLSSMMTLTQTADQKDSRLIHWQDFNAFLIEPERELANIAAHFDIDLPNIDELIAGPIMNRYSKDPSHAYSPDLRKQLLYQARVNFTTDIQSSLKWVKDLSYENDKIENILSFVG